MAKYYITMECDGSKIYKTTRNPDRALAFIERHEKLGWDLESLAVDMNIPTPPPIVRDIVRAIESRRGVTLAK